MPNTSPVNDNRSVTELIGLLADCVPVPAQREQFMLEARKSLPAATPEAQAPGTVDKPPSFDDAALTRAAFDDEGFYCIGDAGVFVDPNDPLQCVIFAGRVVEDFKLTTGTFVKYRIMMPVVAIPRIRNSGK